MPRLTGQTGQGGTRSADGACLTPGPAARNFSWVAPNGAGALFSASPQVFWNVSLCWTERHPLPNAPSPAPSQERGTEVARGGVGTQTQKGQRLSTEALTAAPGDQQMAGCGRRFSSREGGAGRSTSRHACVPQGAPREGPRSPQPAPQASGAHPLHPSL